MRRRGSRQVALLCSLGAALAVVPTMASSDAGPTVQAVNYLAPVGYGERHRWEPAQVNAGPGATVTLKNPTAVVHGVEWVGGPATPTCEGGVPVGSTPGASGTNWSGACTFPKVGTYTFYCTVHGPEMTGTVTVAGPTAATGRATAVGETGATLTGTIDPEGRPTSYFFNYGTSTNYGHSTNELPAGEDAVDHTESATLAGLTPGTLYHFQLVASYETGKAATLGRDETFTTVAPPSAPSATTDRATMLTQTGARLNATVKPNREATSARFEYGTSTDYGSSTGEQKVGEDEADHTVSGDVGGLAPNTTYHFRVIARNPLGVTPGGDQQFTTPPRPLEVALPGFAGVVFALPPQGAVLASREAGSGAPRASAAVVLASSQHGGVVHGTVSVPAADAGARLRVELFAQNALLAKVGHAGLSRVGRLLRASVRAGRVPFSVSLTAQGRHALRRHRRLALTVAVTVAPRQGAASTLTRHVLLER